MLTKDDCYTLRVNLNNFDISYDLEPEPFPEEDASEQEVYLWELGDDYVVLIQTTYSVSTNTYGQKREGYRLYVNGTRQVLKRVDGLSNYQYMRFYSVDGGVFEWGSCKRNEPLWNDRKCRLLPADVFEVIHDDQTDSVTLKRIVA